MRNKDHPLYNTWADMRKRCLSINHPKYKDYGARGISICPEWDDFWVFVSDMGERPNGYSIDRIDNDKGYSPENCRWAARATQQNNTRLVKYAKGYQKRANGKYTAQISIGNQRIKLGTHDCPLMAHLAYRDFRDAWYS